MAQSNRLTKEEIKQDKFIEGVLKSYEYLKENFLTIIITIAVVVVGVVGFSLYQRHQRNQRAEASSVLSKAIENYQEAEESWLDPEKTDESKEQLQTVSTELQTISEKYQDTVFADKARYNYAKTLYQQGDYEGARTEFESIVKSHQPESQILALYAQKAIGHCYEQAGAYEQAIEAYKSEKYPTTSQLSPAIRESVVASAKFNQAFCYERLGRSGEALALYQDLIDLFRENLEKAIQQKSLELTPSAKKLIEEIPESLAVQDAANLENAGRHYDAFIAYADAIHRYKVDKEIHGGLTDELRGQIRKFETKANGLLKNLKDAKRYESEGRNSTALYYYGQAVGLDFVPSRNLYEKALLHRDRIKLSPK